MKKFVILSIVSMVLCLFVYGNSIACITGKCEQNNTQNNTNINLQNTDVDITNRNNNKNTNVNTNLNVNTNVNENTNVNVNRNKQSQEQNQGQIQGQLQGQMQGQTAHNDGVNQKVNIESSVNHIQPTSPGVQETRLVDHDQTLRIKNFGSLFSHLENNEITMKQAKKASKGASDVKVEHAIIWEPDIQLDNLYVGYNKGVFMGYIYLLPDGNDVTLAQLEARAAVEAMKAGATGIIVYYDSGKYLEGITKGIGLGGGSSVSLDNSGSAVVAPGFGTGWSKTKSSNEHRPAIVIECYHNPYSIVE